MNMPEQNKEKIVKICDFKRKEFWTFFFSGDSGWPAGESMLLVEEVAKKKWKVAEKKPGDAFSNSILFD